MWIIKEPANDRGQPSAAPQHEATISSVRHSGSLLAGIRKDSLDSDLRRYDELTECTYLG